MSLRAPTILPSPWVSPRGVERPWPYACSPHLRSSWTAGRALHSAHTITPAQFTQLVSILTPWRDARTATATTLAAQTAQTAHSATCLTATLRVIGAW